MILFNQESGGVQEDLTNKFMLIFPSWQMMLATLIALTILIIVLTKFLWNPVRKMHNDRKDYIQQNIDSAQVARKEASQDRDKANDALSAAHKEAAEIVSKAKMEAAKAKEIEIRKAKEESNGILESARASVEQEKAKFEAEKKEAIINVALEAAAKVIEKEVSSDTNRKFVEDFIANK